MEIDAIMSAPARPLLYIDFGGGIITSLETDKICDALAKAQEEMENPVKDREAKIASSKAEYNYKYVDFGEATEGLRKTLGKHGVSFTQMPQIDGADMNIVTRLMHAGQFMQSTYPVCTIIPDHRQMGGAMTYARRYALFAACGVSGEDDLDAQPDVTAQPAARSNSGARTAEPPQPKKNPIQTAAPKTTPTQEGGAVTLLEPEVSKSIAETMIASLASVTDRLDLQKRWIPENSALKKTLQPDDSANVTKAYNDRQRALQAAAEPAKKEAA